VHPLHVGADRQETRDKRVGNVVLCRQDDDNIDLTVGATPLITRIKGTQ